MFKTQNNEVSDTIKKYVEQKMRAKRPVSKETLHINSAFCLRKIYGVSFLIPFMKNSITTQAIYLNATAELIFELCVFAKSSDELAKMVAKRFIDIDEIAAINKLKPYIDSYINQGLLEYEN